MACRLTSVWYFEARSGGKTAHSNRGNAREPLSRSPFFPIGSGGVIGQLQLNCTGGSAKRWKLSLRCYDGTAYSL